MVIAAERQGKSAYEMLEAIGAQAADPEIAVSVVTVLELAHGIVRARTSAQCAARQKFLDDLQGRHETAETEPGIYRQMEITGDGFKVFELTSLLPKTGFPVHVAKMAN